MKNFKILLTLFIVVVAMAACKKKTTHGFQYEIHKAGSGNKAKIGDAAFYDVLLYKDDSLLFSTIKEGQPARTMVDDPNKTPDVFYKATMDALMTLKEGDSASLTIPLDTFKVKPAGLETAKKARLTMVIRKFKSKADVDARQKELQALVAAIDSAKPVFKARNKAVGDSAKAIAKAYAAGQMPANIKDIGNGLKIAILREGNGAMPKKGEVVLANYYGVTKDGTNFDGSYERGEPFSFPLGGGQVIPGWDLGFAALKEGTTAVLFVPAALGYGDRAAGKIPANSELIFYVDLIKGVNVE
jgi:FKBP-type peptidyl-prolyl cis-trans isomerase FkpA